MNKVYVVLVKGAQLAASKMVSVYLVLESPDCFLLAPTLC